MPCHEEQGVSLISFTQAPCLPRQNCIATWQPSSAADVWAVAIYRLEGFLPCYWRLLSGCAAPIRSASAMTS